MNTKLTLAVLFALVSVSLCELPTPSKELLEKYEGYKATFYKRLLNAYQKIQAHAIPLSETAGDDPRLQAMKEVVQSVQGRPELDAVARVAHNMGAEVAPLVDKAREALLGLYEQYMREHIGESLDKSIHFIKPYLDQMMPTE